MVVYSYRRYNCCSHCNIFCRGGERISWNNIVLGEMLPKPPAKKGEIHKNTVSSLRVDINKVSDKDFANYVEECKENGFSLDSELESSSYTAFNKEGYKLSLSHYSYNSEMTIKLDCPMKMSTFSWPVSTAGKQLPAPASDTGKFDYEYDDHFSLFVGNMTHDDYSEYINVCAENGFNIDYEKGENYYRADNSDGWHVSIEYEGYNIIRIEIELSEETDSSDSTTDSFSEVFYYNTTATQPETTTKKQEVTTKKPETTTKKKSDTTTKKESTINVGIDPSFKAAMDSYEKFMNEYVAFMKKYNANPDDLNLLTDYADYMNKYFEFVNNFEQWGSKELNAAETAYYIDVQSRVSKKLLEVA